MKILEEEVVSSWVRRIALHDLPADGVLLQQRREELGHVAQLVGLQAVDQRVLPPEALLEALLVRRELDRKARCQQGMVPAGPISSISWSWAIIHTRKLREQHCQRGVCFS